MGKIVVFDVVVLTVMYLALQSSNATALDVNMEVSPKKTGGLVQSIDITCQAGNALTKDVREITMLVLSRERVGPIALLARNSTVWIQDKMGNRVQAKGKITNVPKQSFIQMTLANPEVDDSGVYACVMYYLDNANVYKGASTSTDVHLHEDDLKSTLRHLVDAVSSLKAQLAKEKAQGGRLKRVQSRLLGQVADQERQLEQQINATFVNQGDITLLANHVTGIESQQEEQGLGLKQLTDKDNTTVYFTATHNKTGPFQNGKVVAFGDVIANVGQGYDGHTGVFTAPVSGLYVFYVSLTVVHAQWIVLDLKTNQGQAVGRLMVGDANWNDHSGTSCLVNLRAGVQITPVIDRVRSTSGFTVIIYDTPSYVNKFEGYLLKQL